jgi:hypothetical protein
LPLSRCGHPKGGVSLALNQNAPLSNVLFVRHSLLVAGASKRENMNHILKIATNRLSAISYQLSAISYQLSAIS